MQTSSQGEIGTSTATAPAAARTTNSAAIVEHVDENDVLQPERVRGLEAGEEAEESDGSVAEPRRQRDREHRERRGEHECRPRRELATRDRPALLERVRAVGVAVEHVVDEVRRARGGAVRGERSSRLHPATPVAELRGEDDPREEQQVLRPLARPQGRNRNEGRPPCGTFGELDDSSDVPRERPTTRATLRRRGPGAGSDVASGQHEPEAAALARPWTRARRARRARARARGRSEARARCPGCRARRTGGRCGPAAPS